MSDEPPERFTVSLPPGFDLDLDDLDDLVEQSDHGSRSEYIRAAILDDGDDC
jgi:Arc/MetJ-type ribon-helix-helix transcriptional regulator